MLVRSVSLLLLTLLTGCSSLHVMSHVPLSTMSRLSAMKLLDIEPARLRIAARMPDHIQPRKNGVKVLVAIGANGATKMEFVLEPAVEPEELAPLVGFQRSGARLWSFRLSQTDVDRLQRSVATGGASGQSHVSISAGVEACRRGPLGAKPLPTTTFLRTDSNAFLVLAEDLDLRSVVPEKDLVTKIPPCD